MRSVDRLSFRVRCRLVGARLVAAGLALTLSLACHAAPEPLSCPLPPQSDSGPASLRLTHQGLDSRAARQLATELAPSTANSQDPQALAAAYLRRLGSPVQRSSPEHLDALPPAGGVRFWLAGNPRLTEQDAQRLLDWVESGGRLVAVADDSTLALSATLGVRPMPTRELGGTPQPIMALPLWPNLTQLYLADDDAPAYLGFDDSRHLFDVGDQAEAWASSASATHLLLLPWGAGSVTLLSDTELWSNGRLAQYDNAWLLWYLTQGAAVVIVAQTPPAPLWIEFLQRFGVATLLLALALTLCWWRRPAGGSRAAHRWPELVAALQRDLQRDLHRRRPDLADQGVAERWHYLARLSGLSIRAVGEALRPGPARLSGKDFTRRIVQLRQLRLALRTLSPRNSDDRHRPS